METIFRRLYNREIADLHMNGNINIERRSGRKKIKGFTLLDSNWLHERRRSMTINSKVVLTNHRTRAQCVIHLVTFAADTSNLNKATGIYLRS